MSSGQRDVLVVYGGRSTEHEVSCRSAAFVLRNLDRTRYRVHAVGIDKAGQWWPQDEVAIQAVLGKGEKAVPIHQNGQPLMAADRSSLFDFLEYTRRLALASRSELVCFPVIHGSSGEDGTLQGLLELSEIAFVGPDTLGSAIGMDKVVSKKLAQAAGVPVVPWIDVKQQFWAVQQSDIASRAVAQFGLPLFVKPVRLGSSVGVTKVTDASKLLPACNEALAYDDKIMIEKGLDVREIECAVLGDYEPQVSLPGEIIPHADFYSYDAKYTHADGASTKVPADLNPAQSKRAQDLAKQVFMALELFGMARVDLFLDKLDGAFYFNEVNTIPGFTEISQYPILWQASGLPGPELLDKLIDFAVARQAGKRRLKRAL